MSKHDFSPSRPWRFLRMALLSAVSVFLSGPAFAVIDSGINQTVWQMLNHVSDAKLSDPAWMAKDDDADGLKNGDELVAGTDPASRASSFSVASFQLDANGTDCAINFPTVLGKLYTPQSSDSPGGGSGWQSPVGTVAGTGAVVTVKLPKLAGSAFYRVVVQDTDTDGDGVSDWAEKAIGYDAATANTNGAVADDKTAILAALAAENVVTITATEPVATQPADAATPALDTAKFTISRGGNLLFSSVTIPLDKTGTAVGGTDYLALPASVTLGPGISATSILLTPKANPARNTTATATVAAMAGGGYKIGGQGNATAVIYPAEKTSGSGLTGYYFNSTSTIIAAAYDAAKLFDPATLKLTRVDATVDFTWNNTAPGTGVATKLFTARWSGQVQPQYTEHYFFTTKTDDGVKLWVNGKLLIDHWANQTAKEWTGETDLQAGVLYDIKMEYYQANDTKDESHLYWYSESQVKQIIPAARLYPDAAPKLPPAITSPLTALGFAGQPMSFQVTANAAATFALGASSAPLPAGLTLNGATGLIGGTPTVAGDYQVVLTATNANGTSSSILSLQILNSGNGVTRETWTSGVVKGAAISDIPLATTPGKTEASVTVAGLEDLTNFATNTGERLRGYFTAPATANYYFWLAATNVAELWISNDAEPVNKVRRAWVTGAGTAKQAWTTAGQTNQKTPWLALVAGQRYYFEVIHNCGAVNADAVSVGFARDDSGVAAPIANSTGLVPGYLLTPYDFPAGAGSAGTLYSTNMAPRGSATSKGVGSASLRLSADKKQAILHFSYSGLSAPFTGAQVRSDPFGSKASIIIYDIDAAEKFRPDLRTADGGFIWPIKSEGDYTPADIVTVIETGKAFINVQSATYPDGELRGNFSLVRGSQVAPTLVANPAFTDDHATDAGAARFLAQATFGPNAAEIAKVKTSGFSAWIDAQIALPATRLLPNVQKSLDPITATAFQNYMKDKAWWQASITGPDQLRQRVAYALSQITVLGDGTDSPIGNSNYYDVLVDGAFGNYRDLLKEVTLDPTMGDYLSMRGNDKGDVAVGRHPNENYAREIMQLFSIGLNRLWPDGTFVLDSKGSLVPTYDQEVILGMSRVFTGWQFNQTIAAGARFPTNFSPAGNHIDPMTLVPTHHELGAKRLLDNVVLPPATVTDSATTATYVDATSPYNGLNAYDVNGLLDLDRAVDSIFNHPNAGPYVCRQLIQRLVTSDPSPAYVHRVVAKFNDDGSASHVRGSLAAVVKAILLDGEARNTTAAQANPAFGKQREPVVRMAAIARAFPAAEATGTYSQTGGATLTVTTPTPHLLIAGDSAALDFSGNVSGTPPTQLWNNPSGGTFTVLSSPAPTATTFSITPPGFNTATYTQPANSNILTVNTSGGGNNKVTYSSKVYLKFLTGGAPSGVYTLTSQPVVNGSVITDATTFTVTTADTPTAARSGTVLRPAIAGEFDISGVGSTTGPVLMAVGTHINHNLKVNDRVWIQLSIQSGNVAGEYTVTSIPDVIHFVCTPVVPLNLKNGRIGYGGTVYPLLETPLTRSGTVGVSRSNYLMNNVDGPLLQTPLEAPTVFNFYYPDYKYPGVLAAKNITTPEFQLITDTSVVTLTNTFTSALLGPSNRNGLSFFKNSNGTIYLDLSPYSKTPYSVSDDAGVASLVSVLSTQLGTKLNATTTASIVSFVNNSTNFPTASTTNATDRVREIVNLITTSPEYAIQK